MKTKRCECGQEIALGVMEGTGIKIPVESRTPIYRMVSQREDGTPVLRRVFCAELIPEKHECPEILFVNHFRTCPKAGQFTKPKEKSWRDSPQS